MTTADNLYRAVKDYLEATYPATEELAALVAAFDLYTEDGA